MVCYRGLAFSAKTKPSVVGEMIAGVASTNQYGRWWGFEPRIDIEFQFYLGENTSRHDGEKKQKKTRQILCSTLVELFSSAQLKRFHVGAAFYDSPSKVCETSHHNVNFNQGKAHKKWSKYDVWLKGNACGNHVGRPIGNSNVDCVIFL